MFLKKDALKYIIKEQKEKFELPDEFTHDITVENSKLQQWQWNLLWLQQSQS